MATIPFDELLPEMQGEIVSWIHEDPLSAFAFSITGKKHLVADAKRGSRRPDTQTYLQLAIDQGYTNLTVFLCSYFRTGLHKDKTSSQQALWFVTLVSQGRVDAVRELFKAFRFSALEACDIEHYTTPNVLFRAAGQSGSREMVDYVLTYHPQTELTNELKKAYVIQGAIRNGHIAFAEKYAEEVHKTDLLESYFAHAVFDASGTSLAWFFERFKRSWGSWIIDERVLADAAAYDSSYNGFRSLLSTSDALLGSQMQRIVSNWSKTFVTAAVNGGSSRLLKLFLDTGYPIPSNLWAIASYNGDYDILLVLAADKRIRQSLSLESGSLRDNVFYTLLAWDSIDSLKKHFPDYRVPTQLVYEKLVEEYSLATEAKLWLVTRCAFLEDDNGAFRSSIINQFFTNRNNNMFEPFDGTVLCELGLLPVSACVVELLAARRRVDLLLMWLRQGNRLKYEMVFPLLLNIPAHYRRREIYEFLELYGMVPTPMEFCKLIEKRSPIWRTDKDIIYYLTTGLHRDRPLVCKFVCMRMAIREFAFLPESEQARITDHYAHDSKKRKREH